MKRVSRWWVGCLALAALPWMPVQEMQKPEVGKPAPKFRVNDQTGKAVAVGEPSENWTVLAFYPKASTSGCTKEVCSLRDSGEYFDEYGVNVYGISLDDVQSQAEFHKNQSLTFPLLSDPDGSVARKYGVLAPQGNYTERVTFVLDEQGILRHVDTQVDVTTHGDDLLAMIQELQG